MRPAVTVARNHGTDAITRSDYWVATGAFRWVTVLTAMSEHHSGHHSPAGLPVRMGPLLSEATRIRGQGAEPWGRACSVV